VPKIRAAAAQPARRAWESTCCHPRSDGGIVFNNVRLRVCLSVWMSDNKKGRTSLKMAIQRCARGDLTSLVF